MHLFENIANISPESLKYPFLQLQLSLSLPRLIHSFRELHLRRHKTLPKSLLRFNDQRLYRKNQCIAPSKRTKSSSAKRTLTPDLDREEWKWIEEESSIEIDLLSQVRRRRREIHQEINTHALSFTQSRNAELSTTVENQPPSSASEEENNDESKSGSLRRRVTAIFPSYLSSISVALSSPFDFSYFSDSDD